MKSLFILEPAVLLYLLSLFTSPLNAAEVYVDATYGSDENCSSLQDILTNEHLQTSEVPCQTINAALGHERCSRNCSSPDSPLFDSTVTLSDGVHTLSGCIAITYGQNLTIEGENSGMATVRCAENVTLGNIQSCQTDGLVFRGINFEGCGPRPNVFLNHSNNVVFEHCIFRNNTGVPLRTQFVPSIRLFHTHFLHNVNKKNVHRTDNENTTISRLYRSITTSGGFTYFSRNEEVEIIIDGCMFINNTAEFDESENERPVLFKADGHGGGVLVRLAQVSGATIQITNSIFDSNKAGVDGGGIYFSLSENFSSSRIVLFNNTFSNNVANESTGGAISFNIFSFSFNNSMLVENCRFFNNNGGSAGAVGVSLYDSSSASPDLQDRVSFVDCEFVENQAKDEGTAVGLFALVGVEEFGFPVDFTNCSWLRNSHSSNLVDQVPPEHGSALLAFRFPVNLIDNNIFSGNQGGGISLQSTRLVVHGHLLLHNNSAMRGGGVAMEDTCVLQITPGVNMTFINNSAEFSGGGMYVSFPPIRYTTTIFNRLCFLQYSSPNALDTPPFMWDNVSITFLGNHADLSGAAIYASDFSLCRWIGNKYVNMGNVTSIFGELPEEIADQTPFTYRKNTVTTNQTIAHLATAPNHISVKLQVNLPIVQSGEFLLLEVEARDEVGNSREAIISLESPNRNPVLSGIAAQPENITYQVPPANLLLSVQECPNITVGSFTLNFSLPGTLSDSTNLSLMLNGCHPGYRLDTESCTCVCALGENRVQRCESNGRYLLLFNGVWGDTVNTSDGVRRLVTGYPPVDYLACNEDRQGRLPGCRFEWDNVNAQCVTGREGTFCGKCTDGYGVTLDLQDCVENTGNKCTWGLVVFIVLCFLVVILSFLILFFNVGLPNELKGLLFYVQVVGLIFRPYQSLQLVPSTTFLNFLSVIVNLMGFSLPIPLCISTNVQAQHVALLGYISPVLVLITVLVYALSARCLKVLSNRSALSGITLLSLFIYKYVADTSFTLITCSRLDKDWVFAYNGSVSCTKIDGLLIITILALLVVILFVGPTPFAVGYICVKRRPQKFQHYADVLTAGIRAKRHWFGGYDIARRLPFIIFGFTSTQPSIALGLMFFGAVSILVIHLIMQPYDKHYINVIEAIILMNLVAVAALALYSSARFPQGLLAFLLLAPFIYGLLYGMCTVGLYIHKRLMKTKTIQDNVVVGNALSAGQTLAQSGRRLWRKRTSSFGMAVETMSQSVFYRRRGSTVCHSNPTELDEFAEFRESLLDS